LRTELGGVTNLRWKRARRSTVAKSWLWAIADLNANVERILQLLEGDLGGDEGLPEEDA
jgi:hypothetical protein